MKPNPENELESLVDRELKALPTLPAPRALTPRIMAAITARAEAPWYRRPWYSWSPPLRAAYLTALLAMFGGLGYGAWKFFQTETVVTTTGKVAETVSVLETMFRALGALRDAALQVVQHVGTGYVVGAAAFLGIAYALCMGLGSVCVRLAYARR